jgi:hypothetical protein
MNKVTASLCTTVGALASTVALTTSVMSPADAAGARPDIPSWSHDITCDGSSLHAEIHFSYKGHVSALLFNDTGLSGRKDYFFSDGSGGYDSVTYKAGERVWGDPVHARLVTTGGAPADIKDPPPPSLTCEFNT